MRVALAAAAVALAVSASALANSDPASHVLATKDVFLPAARPQKQTAAALAGAVDRVYARGERIKVAVIASTSDLGGLGALWGQPRRYAWRLSVEIRPLFIGPLLVVMPAGFGIYDGGRSTAAERRVLAGIRVAAPTADALTATAASAVKRLLAAGALRSKDITPPRAGPLPSFGRRGDAMKLYYTAQDDSDRVRMHLSVNAGGRRVARLLLPLRRLHRRQTAFWIRWRVPKKLPRGGRFCVAARDAAGNRSPTTCEVLSIR